MDSLRKGIGYIALGLPLALILGENVRDWALSPTSTVGKVFIESSISAYFHTGMREMFVGSLCAIGVFMICYKGYERRDNIAAKIAGACAFLIAFFPTTERSREASDTGVTAPNSVTVFSDATAMDPAYVGKVHFISAAVFFITLAIMSLILFTKSTKPSMTDEKKQRNMVYVVCGITMLVCVALIALAKFFMSEEWNNETSVIFWLESIAVVAFGISWLTKAEVFLADRPAV